MKLLILLILLVPILGNAQTKIKVACVGNSITEGAGIDEALRYPNQLQKLLGDNYEVRNYGLGGRTLLKRGDFPYWQEQKYKEAMAWLPDIVIIKLGTNDSKPQNWIYSEEFEHDYREFIQSFKRFPGKRKIFICTPIPVYKDGFGITATVVSDEIIPMTQKVAKSENATLIDLYTPMLDKAALAPDGIHPDSAGAKIIAEEVYKALAAKLALRK
jgi:acyl-CoA thioesterase I